MSWLDIDAPEPVYADSPYYLSGGVSLRSSPGYYTQWAAPGYDPVFRRPERELSEAEQVLERERQIRKDLEL